MSRDPYFSVDENAVPSTVQVAQSHYISVLDPEDEVYGESSRVLRPASGVGGDSSGRSCGWWPASPRGPEVESEMRYQEGDDLGLHRREAWPVRVHAEPVQLDNLHIEGGYESGDIRE